MATNKFYTVKKVIKNTEYKAQFSGISTALKATDQSKIDGTDVTSVEKMAQYLLDNIIVEPKGLTPNDFDTLEEFNEVIAFASGVMRGEFRDQADEGAAEKKGNK